MEDRLTKRWCRGVLLFPVVLLCALRVSAFAGDIAIFGDSQSWPGEQRIVVKAVAAAKPSVVFKTGDNVDNGLNPSLWKRFNDINAPLLQSREYFPALGNHDSGSPLFFENFPWLDGHHWYVVTREGIRFIVLDSNVPLSPDSEQYEWLLKELESGVAPGFTVVIFHHPIFDVGIHAQDSKHLGQYLLPLFEKYGVSAVFSGHDHNYQRFEYKGIFFIVTGGGGGMLYGKTRNSPYLKVFVKAHHFCLLSPEGGTVRVKAISDRGRIIDEFVIAERKP